MNIYLKFTFSEVYVTAKTTMKPIKILLDDFAKKDTSLQLQRNINVGK